jgi:hypothetical protein
VFLVLIPGPGKTKLQKGNFLRSVPTDDMKTNQPISYLYNHHPYAHTFADRYEAQSRKNFLLVNFPRTPSVNA